MKVIYVLTSVSLIVFHNYNGVNGKITYTEEEREAIKELRDAIGNAEPYSDQYKKYMKKNEFLGRFLRDRSLDVKAIKSKFLNMLKWRKIQNIDEILNEEMSDLSKLFPYQVGVGEDLEGDPIMTVPFGPKWDLRRFILRGADGRNRLARYSAKLLEKGSIFMVDRNKDYGIVIMDMSNYNARQHGCVACVPFYIDLLTQFERYYLGSVKMFYFINTPRIWENMTKILLPVISPITSKVVKIHGYNKQEWQDELLKTINPNQLPPEYGGTRQY